MVKKRACRKPKFIYKGCVTCKKPACKRRLIKIKGMRGKGGISEYAKHYLRGKGKKMRDRGPWGSLAALGLTTAAQGLWDLSSKGREERL